MKFPYELSEQRISLLSKEDQRIYRFEHSDFFDYNTKQKCMQEYQNALLERQGYYVQEIKRDPQFNTLNESEVFETANELTLYEASNYAEQLAEFLDECILENIYTEDEATEFLKEFIDNFNEMSQQSLNEGQLNEVAGDTDGPDMTYWAAGLGGLFGGIMSLIIALIMRGKTKMAIRMLENYMNEIVEKVDDGVMKTKGRGLLNRFNLRGVLSKLPGVGRFFGKKELQGEQNTMCLRTIQENFLADIAGKSMVLYKNIGLLPDDWQQAMNALTTGNYNNGGYQRYIVNNIIQPINDLENLRTNS